MDRTDFPNRYMVASGETIRIRTRHLGVGPYAVASLPAREIRDGVSPPANAVFPGGEPDPEIEQAFFFTVEGETGEREGIVMSFDFPEPPSPGAEPALYRIWIAGSAGGTEVDAGTVRQDPNATDATSPDIALMFKIS